MTQALVSTFRNLRIAFRDANGYPMGTDSTPDAVTNGTSTNAYYYDKPIDIGGVTIERPTISGRGGGKVWVRRIANVGEPSNASLNLSAYDSVLNGYIVGTTPDTTTNANFEVVARNSRKASPPAFIVMATTNLALADGSEKFLHRIYLNAQINLATEANSSQGTGENPNPLAYEIVPNYSSRLPWGQLISANSNLSIVDDSDISIEVLADYQLAFTTYVDDGSSTSDAFQLPYTPATTTIAEFLVYNEGVDDSSNVSVAADGQVSLTAANTAGDIMVIFYPVADGFTATS